MAGKALPAVALTDPCRREPQPKRLWTAITLDGVDDHGDTTRRTVTLPGEVTLVGAARIGGHGQSPRLGPPRSVTVSRWPQPFAVAVPPVDASRSSRKNCAERRLVAFNEHVVANLAE
jgi:hypothetical protein